MTEEDGTFHFTALPSPPWALSVDHPDYAPAVVPIEALPPTETLVRLSAGGSLTGVVLDDWRGEPLAGAEVHLEGASADPSPASQLTDLDGSYRWERLPMGAYTIEAHSPSRIPASTTVDIQRTTVRAPTLRLMVAGAITGIVVDNLGRPAPSARVGTGGLEVIAGDDGRFRLAPLSPGIYRIDARHLTAGPSQHAERSRGSRGRLRRALRAPRASGGGCPGDGAHLRHRCGCEGDPTGGHRRSGKRRTRQRGYALSSRGRPTGFRRWRDRIVGGARPSDAPGPDRRRGASCGGARRAHAEAARAARALRYRRRDVDALQFIPPSLGFSRAVLSASRSLSTSSLLLLLHFLFPSSPYSPYSSSSLLTFLPSSSSLLILLF